MRVCASAWALRRRSTSPASSSAAGAFSKSRFATVVATARDPEAGVLTPEALGELEDLQNWVMGFEYTASDGTTVSLANACKRAIHEEPQQPCFQYSVLDCFREGRAFVPGHENNTVYYQPYGNRASFRDFDFESDMTREYLEDQCKQWVNVGTNWKMVLPVESMNFEPVTAPETPGQGGGNASLHKLSGPVKSTRLFFGTIHEDSLDALEYIDWKPRTEGDTVEFGTADYKGREKAVDVIKADPAVRAAAPRALAPPGVPAKPLPAVTDAAPETPEPEAPAEKPEPETNRDSGSEHPTRPARRFNPWN